MINAEELRKSVKENIKKKYAGEIELIEKAIEEFNETGVKNYFPVIIEKKFNKESENEERSAASQYSFYLQNAMEMHLQEYGYKISNNSVRVECKRVHGKYDPYPESFTWEFTSFITLVLEF